MVEKAAGLRIDAVFLDLEDSVPPDAKESARLEAVDALKRCSWQAGRVTVRINALSSPWAYRDVIALVEGAGKQLQGLLLPKGEHADDVRWLDRLLHQIEAAVGLPAGGIAIDVLIEDAAGLRNSAAIAAASPRVQSLVFGPLDYSADLGSRAVGGSDGPAANAAAAVRHHALLQLLTAARSAGAQAIDGPWTSIGDLDGLRREAEFAASLGFDGKMVLHPDQIPCVNEVFSPTPEEHGRARAVIEAWEEHVAASNGRSGAVRFDGEMIDEASRKWAQRVISRATASGLVDGGDRCRR
jgi:citrate lyase subunit beta/citryl-CoA lyase